MASKKKIKAQGRQGGFPFPLKYGVPASVYDKLPEGLKLLTAMRFGARIAWHRLPATHRQAVANLMLLHRRREEEG